MPSLATRHGMRCESRRRAGFTLIELLVRIAIIALLMPMLILVTTRVRQAANRANVTAWLDEAYRATMAEIVANRPPFRHATDVPDDLLARVQTDPEDPDHLTGWGYDINYSATDRPASFTWEAVPREPGLTGTTRIVRTFPAPSASSRQAAAVAASEGTADGSGEMPDEDGGMAWEEEIPGWREAQAAAFLKSTTEALAMVGELAGGLSPGEQQTAFDVMTNADDRRAVWPWLDRDGDGQITLEELNSHPDPLTHEVLQRIVVGPWKLGVAGETLDEIGVAAEDVDFSVPFPTYSDLGSLFERYSDEHKSVASFLAKLTAADAAEKRGQPRAAIQQLRAAKNEVRAQTGKALKVNEAHILENLLDVFIAHLDP